MNTINYGSLRSCIQKPLPHEEDHINNNLKSNALKAAFYTKKLWPQNYTIKIQFLEDPDVDNGSLLNKVAWTPMQTIENRKDSNGNLIPYDPIEVECRKLNIKDAIKLIIEKRIKPLVGLNFTFVQTGGEVRIGFSPSQGAYSLVGTDCIQPGAPLKTMNLGWLDASTIIHEFGHVLGLIHEHQNPNGIPIDWDVNQVYAWAKQTQGWDKSTTDTNIIDKYKATEINGSDFDPKSIMLYFFPPILTKDHKGTQMNSLLSPMDIEWIGKTYPGGTQTLSNFYSNAYGISVNNTGKYIFLGLIIFLLLMLLWYIKNHWNFKITEKVQ